MDTSGSLELRAPYLLFVGEAQKRTVAKTGAGIVQWRRNLVAGQLRTSDASVDLGVPDLDLRAAAKAGARSLIIAVAPPGGAIPPSWTPILVEAANLGLDIVSGMHSRLDKIRDLVDAALRSGARLIDVRVPPDDLPIASGERRPGKRVLTVGTDSAVGKKYTALALHASMQSAGMHASFRATGQTGIMIAGSGIPIDAVVSDFVAGAAETLSPANAENHWDVIEGQGSLLHPAYAAVTAGLAVGSQPDAFVVCHDPGRKHLHAWPRYPLPKIGDLIELHERLGRRVNPNTLCVGISLNTSALKRSHRNALLIATSAVFGVPCVDPLIEGCDLIVEHINAHFRP